MTSNNPDWKPEYEVHPVNEGQRTLLLENGMIVQLYDNGKWYIRRYCPTETMDSKWDVWLNQEPGQFTYGGRPIKSSWGAAACMCFSAIDENGFDSAEEAIIVALGTDWEEYKRQQALKHKEIYLSESKILDENAFSELINSESFKRDRKELHEKVLAEQKPYLDQGFTHQGWASGEGGDNVYLKEVGDCWVSERGVKYKKSNGLAVVISEQAPLHQLNLNSIKVLEKSNDI